MRKNLVVIAVAAFAALSMVGVGFAALQAADFVFGTVSAANVQIQITSYGGGGCSYTSNGAAAPASIAWSGLNAAQTEITLTVSNIGLGMECGSAVQITNTGPVAVSLSAGLLFAGHNGICAGGNVSCWDVFTLSGIQASGFNCFGGSYQPCGVPTDNSNNFIALNPGQSFVDSIGIAAPSGSSALSTPSTASFAVGYLATETT